MKLKVVFVAVFACAVIAADLLACGNKFLVPSRGTRFGKAPVARHEAKILVYAPPDSSVATALGGLEVATLLAEVGYAPTTVSGPDELYVALSLGEWNLVLADTSNLPEQLKREDAPAILPVLHEPSRTQLAEAREDYGQAIKAPTKSRRFVETVDYAVAAHSKPAEDSMAATAR